MDNISWTTLTFLSKFTQDELLSVKHSDDPQVEYFFADVFGSRKDSI